MDIKEETIFGKNITVKENVYLAPDKVNNNLMKNIFDYYTSTYKGKCTQKNGYIIDLIKINRIISNFISRVDFNIVFEVEFDIIAHIPNVGDIHTCEVFLVFKEGFFAILQNLKIFVHNNKFPKYSFDYTNSTYINDDNGDVLEIGSIVQVEILGTKYKDKNFSCFGSVVLDQ